MDEFNAYEGAAWGQPPQPPRPARSPRRWWLAGALALAFLAAMGVGAVLGSTLLRTAQAAALAPGATVAQLNAQLPLASTPGAAVPGQGQQGQGQGQCTAYTVTSVSGQTILAKAADGSTVTIHTTSGTQYTKAGQSATASAVTAGAQISVMGTHNSDGSITATSIDVR